MCYRELLNQHSCYESRLCEGGSYLGVAPRARCTHVQLQNLAHGRLGPIIVCIAQFFTYALIILYS